MKKIFFLITIVTASMNLMAQGNGNGNGHGKGHEQEQDQGKGHKHGNGNGQDHDRSKDDDRYDQDAHHSNSSQKGYEKNQPKKVTSAFYRDYPAASNVSWSKYKGDYTATFRNGPWRSTAVYHANGQRRDTRTPLTRKQLPGTIWDRIFKRDNLVPVEYVQIERPSGSGNIFRIISTNNKAYYYDLNGNRVSYNY